ncbi:MAG: nitrate reductase associated protein [Fibrobacterota bacterium]|nr:nitrate reductase associated protein [Fibrobacterota bacterium]
MALLGSDNSQFFGFEADFVDSLRCIPMAVRFRLDVTGVKMKLNEWSKLDKARRVDLAQTPCATEVEIRLYREEISLLVEKTSGSPPSMLAELPVPVWESPDEVPVQVINQARDLDLEVPLQAWACLSTLQRFALIKLSRSGHENRNFLPAMFEFGLAPKPD